MQLSIRTGYEMLFVKLRPTSLPESNTARFDDNVKYLLVYRVPLVARNPGFEVLARCLVSFCILMLLELFALSISNQLSHKIDRFYELLPTFFYSCRKFLIGLHLFSTISLAMTQIANIIKSV